MRYSDDIGDASFAPTCLEKFESAFIGSSTGAGGEVGTDIQRAAEQENIEQLLRLIGTSSNSRASYSIDDLDTFDLNFELAPGHHVIDTVANEFEDIRTPCAAL